MLTQLLKKFPAFYGTKRFIAVFTRARHWSLSWARWIQSTSCHHISRRSILIIFPFMPRFKKLYKGVSKSFRTGRLERWLHVVQLSATRCSCVAILWVNLVSFATITICVASQRVRIVVRLYLIIDSVRKLLDTPSYTSNNGELQI
jgi:hypothetical protein